MGVCFFGSRLIFWRGVGRLAGNSSGAGEGTLVFGFVGYEVMTPSVLFIIPALILRI